MILGVVQDFALTIKAGEVSTILPEAKGDTLLRFRHVGSLSLAYVVQACLEFRLPIDGVIKPKWNY